MDFDTFSKSDFRAVKVKECIAVPKSKKLLQFTLDDGTVPTAPFCRGIHAYYEPEELVGKTLIAITNCRRAKMMGVASEGMLMSAIHEVPGDDGEPEERLNLPHGRRPHPRRRQVVLGARADDSGRPPSQLRRRGPSFVSSLTAGE